jgi:carbon-monoxide dehydrogenase small subunit
VEGSTEIQIQIRVNGEEHQCQIPARMTLLQFIREQLGLTGTKEGCGKGECGACTVLVDDKPVNSCLMLAAQASGHAVTTIEGLSPAGRLDPIQKAFIAHGAVQCGYCIPGMIMTAKALLLSIPHPRRDQVQEAISGNLCRCTGYSQIIDAILAASADL